MKKQLLLSALLLLLSACGWHLRGANQVDLDINSVYIRAENVTSNMASDLKRALTVNRIAVTDSSTGADYAIFLSHERNSRRAVSVGNDALVTEYELTLSIDYRIEDSGGKIVAPKRKAEVIRSYEFDRNAMVAKAQEESLILSEMQNAIIQQILRQLRFVSQSRSTAPTQTDSSNGQTAP